MKDAQTINQALGYEMNTIEFAMQDGVPYAIDFLNPAPDFERDRITEFYFEQVVEQMARLAIDRACAEMPRIRGRDGKLCWESARRRGFAAPVGFTGAPGQWAAHAAADDGCNEPRSRAQPALAVQLYAIDAAKCAAKIFAKDGPKTHYTSTPNSPGLFYRHRLQAKNEMRQPRRKRPTASPRRILVVACCMRPMQSNTINLRR